MLNGFYTLALLVGAALFLGYYYTDNATTQLIKTEQDQLRAQQSVLQTTLFQHTDHADIQAQKQQLQIELESLSQKIQQQLNAHLTTPSTDQMNNMLITIKDGIQKIESVTAAQELAPILNSQTLCQQIKTQYPYLYFALFAHGSLICASYPVGYPEEQVNQTNHFEPIASFNKTMTFWEQPLLIPPKRIGFVQQQSQLDIADIPFRLVLITDSIKKFQNIKHMQIVIGVVFLSLLLMLGLGQLIFHTPREQALIPKAPLTLSNEHHLYARYLAIRQNTQESTDRMNYEEFIKRIKTHRDQLMKTNLYQDVQFDVYQKDGKASLKAIVVKKKMRA